MPWLRKWGVSYQSRTLQSTTVYKWPPSSVRPCHWLEGKRHELEGRVRYDVICRFVSFLIFEWPWRWPYARLYVAPSVTWIHLHTRAPSLSSSRSFEDLSLRFQYTSMLPRWHLHFLEIESIHREAVKERTRVMVPLLMLLCSISMDQSQPFTKDIVYAGGHL